jgi:hypothetical protein
MDAEFDLFRLQGKPSVIEKKIAFDTLNKFDTLNNVKKSK